jgi:cytochrome d ubiquinol oxidase subunit II
MTGLDVVYVLMGVGLAVYVVTAGADLGAGVWDLLARGPRAESHRRLVDKAIGPIWETNHVWLIFVVVLMFSVFPIAFSRISIALHVPITLALVGIVLRGAGFIFRSYGLLPPAKQARWGRVFGGASAVTPVFLGLTLGALSTGRLSEVDVSKGFKPAFVDPWLSLFPVSVGLYALGLFALLAAVYLFAEAEGDVREDFRRRAIVAEVVGFLLAGGVALAAQADAPRLFSAVTTSGAQWLLQAAVAGCALGVVHALWRDAPGRARVLVAAQVGLIVIAWGLAMDGHLAFPDLTLEAAAPTGDVRGPILTIVVVGALILGPSLWYLFRVFKGR